MSASSPTTRVSFFNVPFPTDYSAVVDFSSATAQVEAFNILANKGVTFTKVNYIRKDKAFKIKGNFADFEKYNYCRYQNQDYTNPQGNKKWYYAFIDRIEYVGEDVTMIYITTDVWQTWQFNVSYKKSLVERSHIPKSQDIVGKWIAPEPLSLSGDYSKQIDALSFDWTPIWSLNTVSLPEGNGEYIYGGNGSGAELTGIYSTLCYTSQELQLLIRGWISGAIDHREDIIDISALPFWLVNLISSEQTTLTIQNNKYYSVSDNISLNNTTLANGYTPKNKKLLTSICKAYALYNRNGFCEILKPELFTSLTPSISISGRPIGCDQFRIHIGNYNGDINEFYSLPYSCHQSVAFNQNTGTIKSINKLSALLGLVKSGVSSAFNVVGGISTIASGTTAKLPTQYDVALSSAQQIGTPISNVVESGKNLAEALADKRGGGGTTVDTTDITPSNIQLRIMEVNPLYNECVMADDFLDVYGYAINEIMTPNFKSRSQWNYIKTNNINLSIDCNNIDGNIFRAIFNNGVTVWHNINNFGNYELSND